MREMSETECAWLAGIFEGEGCLTTTNTGWTVAVSMTDSDVVMRCKELTGIGTYIVQRRRGTRKVASVWRTSRRDDIRTLMLALRPWLGQRRTERVDEFLADYDEWAKRRADKPRAWDHPERGVIDPGGCPQHPDGGRYRVSRKCVECHRAVHRRAYRRKHPNAATYKIDRLERDRDEAPGAA